MADTRLRFSGWHIPLEHWGDYPCWQFALDEEGVEGQDETTMRPCAEPLITRATDVAAAHAIAADGQRFPAMVALTRDRASVNGFMIYLDRTFDGRIIELRHRRDGTWREYSSHPHWTSVESEPGLLPVRLVTLASHQATGAAISIEITDVDPWPRDKVKG